MGSLGDRMKSYEAVPKNYLMRRTPVIIRIDGCHFHSFTKGFARPFDAVFMLAMQATTAELCKRIQGCVLGYTQSDEISLVLCDYQRLDTAAWFDDQVEKICSVSASMAAMIFNKEFEFYVGWLHEDPDIPMQRGSTVCDENTYEKAIEKGGYFDSRCFNLSKEEVCNYLIWRQQDAERNSVLSLAQSLYSHKELQGISCRRLQDKMFTEKGVNWNDFSPTCKRGTFIVRDADTVSGWSVVSETPIITQNREFVESRINFE